ncbi:glycoside hydrolase family 44 protein [Jatrophihabitans sp.]|uniref:RCC1 domain-containing protein n=1 Tax=Jatrophihabitans sp. TaxID=1932789 RepID=UPI0030C772B9|nr:hypothetical protein [Jatrophihabitans sp.]
MESMLRRRRAGFTVLAVVAGVAAASCVAAGSASGAANTARPAASGSAAPSPVRMIVNTATGHQAISPLIYGLNNPDVSDSSVITSILASSRLGLVRLGGNRFTAYNWENNASNAGSDYQYENDDYLSSSTTPGAAVQLTVRADKAAGVPTLVTVPIGSYVAADTGPGGDVRNSGSNYLTTRFRKNIATSPTQPLSTVPNTNDGSVYEDQFVHWLTKTNPTAKLLFSLDNEVNDWDSTHAELYSQNLTYAQLVARDTRYATMIKSVDPAATVTGPVLDGFQGEQDPVDNNGSSPDYQKYGAFLPYYLKKMKAADTAAGKRLVDILDLHWYPQVSPDIFNTTSTPDVVAAREQAPRSLWDPTYTENSWISQYLGGPIHLIPTVQKEIAADDPGMGLGFTEWNYGGGGDISGAIATADTLGIFGRTGVAAATLWPQFYPDEDYTLGALQLFRNYNGNGAAFGDTEVTATDSDTANTSIYASVSSTNASRVTVVAINKNTTPTPTSLSIKGLSTGSASVYTLTAGSPTPKKVTTLVATGPDTFSYTMPAQSVSMIVPTAAAPAPAFYAQKPPTAIVGLPYSFAFGATGTPAPTYAVASGSLPAGLSLKASTGVLSGTATTAGSSTFTISASNSVGTATTATITLKAVVGAAPTLVHASPPAAAWAHAYSYPFTATGVPAPTFTVASGALPAGLTLNDTSGVLSGIPTSVATSTFTVTASNGISPDATSATLTIVVAPPPRGTVLSWGADGTDQLGAGDRSTGGIPQPVTLPAGATAVQVAAGQDHSLALTSSGEVYAWGDDNCGQLGDGESTGCNANLLQPTPTLVTFPSGTPAVTAIAAGWKDSFARTADGNLWAWGDDGVGELGDGNSGNYTATPVQVSLGAEAGKITAVAAAAFTTYALTSDHTVLSWGNGANAALGNGETGDSLVQPTPAPVTLGAAAGKVTAIAAGGSQEAHAVALTSTGAVYTWGGDADGQLGTGVLGSPAHDSSIAVKVVHPAGASTLPVMAEVGASSYGSYAITTSGALYAWGNDGFGELGDGQDSTQHDAPVLVAPPAGQTAAPTMAAATGGDFYGTELDTSGVLYTNGANGEGELGTGTPDNSTTPTAAVLPASTAISGMSAGPQFVLAIVR